MICNDPSSAGAISARTRPTHDSFFPVHALVELLDFRSLLPTVEYRECFRSSGP